MAAKKSPFNAESSHIATSTTYFSGVSVDEDHVLEVEDEVHESTQMQVDDRANYHPNNDDLLRYFQLPSSFDPQYHRELSYAVLQRFDTLEHHYQTAENPTFGSDGSLIQVTVDSLAGTHGSSVISWNNHISQLWRDQCHFHRSVDVEGELSLSHEIMKLEDWQNNAISSLLLPWERYRPHLEYGEIAESTKRSQTIGISFPKLDLADHQRQFRLLVLLPSFGAESMPLQGCLIISTLYLHSCFIAVRYSRGYPEYRSEMIIDGRAVAITKNLELFLRSVRHPKQPRILYIRELCIDRGHEQESDRLFNGRFQGLVEDCSCGVVDMSRAMEMLDDEGLIPEPARITKKLWHEAPSGADDEIPWHMPLVLKWYPDPDDGPTTPSEIAELPSYEYMPLDLVAREIRLLGVWPAKSPQDPIVVDVVHLPMRSDRTKYYHALSYCWGSPKITRYLRQYWGMKIGVTENLYTALLQFRSGMPEEIECPFYIWVDAICIDQNNDTERNRIIPRMHDIYEAAAIVMVSIAPSHTITNETVQGLQAIARDSIDHGAEDKRVDELCSLDVWAALYDLFRLPYFNRRWVVQELASASAPLIMMGEGHEARALRTISRAATLMALRLSELLDLWTQTKHPIVNRWDELKQIAHPDTTTSYAFARDLVNRQFQQVKTVDYIRNLNIEEIRPSFLFLIILTQPTKCDDPHDRLYSLSNISKERPYSTLRASYQDSIEECYMQFTQFYIQQTRSLDIICVSQSPAKANRIELCQNLSWNFKLDIPSWCPDYQQDGPASPLVRRMFIQGGKHTLEAQTNLDHSPYHADKVDSDTEIFAKISFEGRAMIVQGVIVDTVEFISSEPENNTPISDFDDVSSRWSGDILNKMLSGGQKIYTDENFKLSDNNDEAAVGIHEGDAVDDPTSEHVFNALLTDFLSMAVGERSGVVKARVTSENPSQQSFLGYEWTDGSDFQGIEFFDSRTLKVCRGRRLIVTKNGYMGLAPWHVREGFQLAILCGCSVPVLLEYISEEAALMMTTNDDAIPESERETFRIPYRNVTPGWYFRGDCFVQGWMEGEMMKQYGNTTQEVWERLNSPEFELTIH